MVGESEQIVLGIVRIGDLCEMFKWNCPPRLEGSGEHWRVGLCPCSIPSARSSPAPGSGWGVLGGRFG